MFQRMTLLCLAVSSSIFLLSAPMAEAKRVGINGYHSRDAMKQSCASSGGEYVEVESGGETTYGCENAGNSTSAYCNTRTETCFGYVPDRRVGSGKKRQ